MMKNIKTFDRTNKTECIDRLSQIEATAMYADTPFQDLVCQGMAPSMFHVLSELSSTSTNQDIKEIILANYSDILSTAQAVARLQIMQIQPTQPLASFNTKYEAIH